MSSPTINSMTIGKIVLFLLMGPLLITSSMALPARLATGNAGAFVVAGSIVVFAPNVSEQQREDVINGTLFVQLVANAKYNREKSQLQWYKVYDDGLMNIGFVESSFNLPQQVTDATFTMEAVALKFMKDSATPAALDVAKAALEALRKLPATDKSIVLFDNRSSGNTPSGNYQLLFCDQAANGELGIGMGAFYFQANKYDPRFMWSQWSKDSVTLFAGKETLLLNEDVYAQERDVIAKRLGDHVLTLVSEIQL